MNRWSQFSWGRTCIELALGTSIALLLYLATMNFIVGKSFLFSVDTKRIIEVYKFCSSMKATPHKEANFIIGSSVAVEGIDADLLDQTLHNGTNTYNLGVVGLSPVEALILGPALKAGKPQFVVIGIDAMSVGVGQTENTEKESIDFEKLQAYRAMNPIAQMDSPVKKELLENILLPKEKAILESHYLGYLLGCRSLPIFFMEGKLRELTRKGLRTQGIVTNFKSPWMLKVNLTGDSKERIINSAIGVAQGLSFDGDSRNIKALRALTRLLQAENIALMLVVWPLHPRILSHLHAELLDKTDTTLKALAQESESNYLNYSKLLSDTDFADALHPNSEGRAKLSIKLAEDIKSFSAHLSTP
ncbi:MAG: hypothetical protein JST84_16855 [Acidobacteria bacterium]|nr:hypothetical protein [Acidobacteriota bacterium]